MTRELIFAVNPGATSTKCALYQRTAGRLLCCADETIEHFDGDLAEFNGIADQQDYRLQLVNGFLDRSLQPGDRILACAGRGGMLTPVPSGAIRVNQQLVDFSLYTPVYQHASNLGAFLAQQIARRYGVEAYIVDPVSVDEFWPVARISGTPMFDRFSFVHALNTRAVATKLAVAIDKPFARLNCVVAHLGAGFSISAIHHGRIVDNDNRMEGAAFTPERAGGIPPIPLIDACFSGDQSAAELKKRLYGEAGLYGYLGTRDLREVEAMIRAGDDRAKLIFEAMVYQIRKSMAAMASALAFELDAFVITGGLAFSERLIAALRPSLEKIAPVRVMPGSNENQALAESAERVLSGLQHCLDWPVDDSSCSDVLMRSA